MGGQILGSMKNGIGKRAKGTISTKHLALFFANCLLGQMQQKIVLGSHWWLWLLNNSSLLWSLIEKENHGIKRGKEWLVIVENQPFFTLPQKTVSASLIIGGI